MAHLEVMVRHNTMLEMGTKVALEEHNHVVLLVITVVLDMVDGILVVNG